MPCGYVYSANSGRESVGRWCTYTYSAWGFCIFARSTIPGNAKASTSRTDNSIALTLFFYKPIRCISEPVAMDANLKALFIMRGPSSRGKSTTLLSLIEAMENLTYAPCFRLEPDIPWFASVEFGVGEAQNLTSGRKFFSCWAHFLTFFVKRRMLLVINYVTSAHKPVSEHCPRHQNKSACKSTIYKHLAKFFCGEDEIRTRGRIVPTSV